MNALTGKIPRIVFAVVMGVFGLFHFMNGPAMAGMVPIPGGVIWVYITGLALIAAAVSIITGKMAKTGSLLLGVMLLIFALTVHFPGATQGDPAATGNFLKDLGLAACALIISGSSKD
ncbi:MAG: DoxX family protein [Calditrichaeota bacterium]|nr:DoxX family protein [Calditrichota bacterium]